jgi:hypothetical protein
MMIPPEYADLSPAKVAKLLKVSITSVTQQRRRDAGLCRYCDQPALDGMTVCAGHRTQRNSTTRQRSRSAEWKPGGRGRPPKKAGE